MKILLVRPWVNNNITTVKNFLFGEPLGIECVATVLKELANITVLVGGVQATCFPNSFFSDDVDFVFKSTTRSNIEMLFESIGKKQSFGVIEGIYSKSQNFINEGIFCQNEYIVPDRQSTAKYRSQYQYVGFSPCALIQTAYGCRNRCNFCIRWKLEGQNLREIDIREIVDQIQNLAEPYVMICDNDFLINEKRLEEFCDLISERKIRKKYICYGSVNSILEKPDAIRRLSKAGLMAVIVGYEAFDDERMLEYNKAATVSENKLATEVLQRNKIACWGSFIIHPDWSKADFKKLVQYVRYLKPELITFSPLVPHPLTPLYEQYKDRLLYAKEEYEKWNFGDVLIRPSQMSLRQYYWQVIKFAMIVNFNRHSAAYTVKNIPMHNIWKMISGFKTIFSVYIKNMMTKK
ncbi:MAG: B12-binding radical protein [Firmicutes bacterium]|nr:B12-binding radical protein [Bacillota bacterium]